MGMDVYGKSGNYFRASIWSWRPILIEITRLNKEKNLGLDLSHWGSNDSDGLHTQEECNKLATAIETEYKPDSKLAVFVEGGLRVNEHGMFDDSGTHTPYSTDGKHILEFAKFLRECGGSFEIC